MCGRILGQINNDRKTANFTRVTKVGIAGGGVVDRKRQPQIRHKLAQRVKFDIFTGNKELGICRKQTIEIRPRH